MSLVSTDTRNITRVKFCVGESGRHREIFSDTGEFEGELVFMGGVPWGKQGVYLYNIYI